MRLSSLNLLVLCIVGEFMGLNIFLKGFFPIKKAVEGYASFQDLPKPWEEGSLLKTPAFDDATPVSPVFGRLVIILIDALRADFVYGERNKADMPYTRELIDRGSTRSFLARAHPPTVTMPRIKALMSGTIPGFVDLVLNFDSAALSEDNLISQMRRHGKRLFFYGDDTWMRLFPGHFADADGTTSFFVTDYTEVDNNVTRHIKPALASNNWDALILHYLGLDHIGHLGGPTSPLVPPKLREMDDVIQNIHEALLEKDKSSALPSLIVLCGDHGMSDAGSHGGASASETLTPIVFMSSAFNEVKGAPTPHPTEVQQIDLAPTLALLMGLPIPQNSLGEAIPTMLEDSLSARQHLRALQLNSHQLSLVLAQNVDSFESDEGYSTYQHALRLHAAWLSSVANGSAIDGRSLGTRTATRYAKATELMRNRVSSSLAKYDLHAMGCGLVLMWLVLLLVIILSLYVQSQTTFDLSVPVSLLIGCCLATGIIHLTLCTAGDRGTSELLCTTSGGTLTWPGLLIAMNGVLSGFVISSLTRLRGIWKFIQSYSFSWFEVFLLVGTIAHSLSLASSSFVEEEHQTWYFLTVTLILALSVHATVTAISKPSDKMAARVAVATTGSLVVFRVLRAWNQTGIKWADRPDIGDWFVRPENKLSLSILTAISFTVIYIARCGATQNYRLAIALVGAYLYRYATGDVSFPVPLPISNKGIYEAWIVYAMVFASLAKVATNYAQYVYKACDQTEKEEMTHNEPTGKSQNNAMTKIAEEFCEVHIMLVALILRPHNSAVTAMLVILQHCIVGLALSRLQPRPWAVALLHVLMGQVAFFAQGNSNSIATVDISAGYIGMNSYVHSVAGLLTAISTYAGPILWILRLLAYTTKHYFNRYPSAALEVTLTLVISRALPLALYATLVSLQRYHLFVWSVFSPKLLYQTMNTYVTTAGIVLILVHCGIGRWFKLHPS